MRQGKAAVAVLLSVTAIAIAFALVTTISSLASPAGDSSSLPPLQGATPTSTETDESEAGSTEGIMGMGIAVVAIIVIPILLHRAAWQRQ